MAIEEQWKEKLYADIRTAMAAQPEGAISFRDYMALCLYHETGGYYNREQPKIGKEGDFYTSASIGTVMGEVIASTFIRYFEASSRKALSIAEWGGGTGRMARIVLDTLAEKAPELYNRLDYRMVESSPYHRAQQLQTIGDKHGNFRQVSTSDWAVGSDQRFLIVWSNELLDAFPVHRVERRGDDLFEWHVKWPKDADRPVKYLRPLDLHGRAALHLKKYRIRILDGQVAEVNPDAVRWIGAAAAAIQEGVLVTIDYGAEADELYAPHRMAGTLLCYRDHQVSDDPFAAPGEQDLTAHVDFTACMQAGAEAGFLNFPLRTQKQFLLEDGVLELLAAHDGSDPFSPAAKRNRAVRQLLLGDSMADTFKVLIQKKSQIGD